MANLDPYSSCPCGSGKKFKWCCQPIYDDILRAFEMNEKGQHEAALQHMDSLIARNATNPEVWGRKAQLLYQTGKYEEAEASLQKAFELNPRYAFGHYLQARFRFEEREIAGALILFRRAAEYYDPNSTLLLSDIHGMIFECEMKLNRPVAARAALLLAVRFNPANQSLEQALTQVFGDETRFPLAARKEYKYLPGPATGERAEAWNKALATAQSGKLTDAVAAFQQLVAQDAQDAAAWYNEGLTWAWLGNNRDAVNALSRYVELEPDPIRAAETWTLAEVLRCGQGVEEQADFTEHIAVFVLRQIQSVIKHLEELQRQQRLIGAQASEEENILTGLILEKMPPALTPELAAKQSPRLGAALMLMSNILNLTNTNQKALEATAEEFRQSLAGDIADVRQVRGPARFSDIFSEAMVFPLGAANQKEGDERIKAGFERFFEETWLQRPLKGLGDVSPLDAAGSTILRKKLRGLVDFLEQCAGLNKFTYDFNRLRRKLGLLDGKPAPGTATGEVDVAALSTAELASVPIEQLAGDKLEQAYQAALKMDARDLAGKFARALVTRPNDPARPDRFAWFNHLIQLAQSSSNWSEALDTLNEAEKYDCENNEGRRRNDYELRRGQLLAKQGDFDQAADTFDRLIARVPSELRFQGTASETMLSAKRKPKALEYAEKGLASARQQNNRDMENYFQELVGAATR